ncbi:AMP-binding protein [Amycolatopsis acidicola]|uniref:AMP-binding protein n=1 Tax=Amycolatopsis acidicola TaxID=2596893 RepID=A0A5N0VG92_9PSEU|nr:AMP-binding protein [Amycolatopsis acidicola]KAA9164464.1 AMP-binding protein [Amycolatopsis acidicola]
MARPESPPGSQDRADSGDPLWLPGAAPGEGRIARARLRSPADIRRVEEHPPEALREGATVYEAIRAAAAEHPDKAAIIQLRSHRVDDPPRTVTYRELAEAIERAANLFHETAAGAPGAVGVLLPMVPEGMIATWGSVTAGIAIPVNPYLEADAVAAILNATGATALVTTPGQFDDAQLAGVRAAVPTLRRILLVDAADSPDDFAAALAAHPAGRLTFTPSADPDAEVMRMPTGGTTGAPKLVRMTHRGQLTVAWNVGALMGARQDGVVGHGMPNFHCGGTLSLGLRTFLYGQTLLTLTPDGFRDKGVVANFWDIARRYRMTSLLATPTTAAALLAVPGTSSEGHSITDFHCGGSTVPLALVRAFHDRFGIWLRENWGMTEVHGTMTGHPGHDREPRVGSAGLPLPHIRVKAVEVDENNVVVRECVPGERGLLVFGTDTVTPGYLDPAPQNELFVQGLDEGRRWASTGDLGTVDEDGYVWIFGRAKDLIIRGGHNIDPAPVEEAIAAHPAVHLAAAIGRPDPLKGELPIAYVQLLEGKTADPAELLDFCRSRIQERASVPVEIIVLDQLPLTPVGKISKPALRRDVIERVAGRVAAEVLGDSSRFHITVDHSGLRPVAVLTLDDPDDDVPRALRAAFAGYEFSTEIRVAAVKR